MTHSLVLPEIAAVHDEMVALRRHIHAHPELGFQEFATSDLVAQRLEEWGYRVTRGVGQTGVVATLQRGPGKSLGIRADMDALPIAETTELPYASTHSGVMHACGHDGHTAMLLAAARYLARQPNFCGTLHLIFQPAEEGGGGAKVMIEDGLFERFPCDAVFAMHNVPGLPTGHLGFAGGPFMCSADTVHITLHGHGGHGAVPQSTVDPVVACAAIVMSLQTIVARNIDPQETAIVTVGAMQAGQAANVIPATATLTLSVRALTAAVRARLEQRITELVTAQAASFGARAEIDYQHGYPVLVNHPAETELARAVALEWAGESRVLPTLRPFTASEDFAFMLEKCPGSYISIGNGPATPGNSLHNPGYDFNDDSLSLGATYWVKLVERFLARPAV
ncbi:M20 aminoacylase family protein [Serratia marcescens]|uniref:M20 aminoacylase family protein n=1 Tax=Serratia marcescens TaxID=615 RepID=UPI0039839F6B